MNLEISSLLTPSPAAAQRITQALVDQIAEIEEAYCFLVSRIVSPIDEPLLVDIRVRPTTSGALNRLKPQVSAVTHEYLAHLALMWRALIERRTE